MTQSNKIIKEYNNHITATIKGKYTSFTRICVEMDLSGALLEAIILEVYDEEWVQTMDNEHIPFRCCKCHEHGHLYRDFPTINREGNQKTTWREITRVSPRSGAKGKGESIHTRRKMRIDIQDTRTSRS